MIKDRTLEGVEALGHVSSREKIRSDLIRELHETAAEVYRMDLQGLMKRTAEDAKTVFASSLRRRVDEIKKTIAGLDDKESGDFVCANRLCREKVDRDSPETEYAIVDVPRAAIFQGREPAGIIWIGNHPALALGYCLACWTHIESLIEERMSK